MKKINQPSSFCKTLFIAVVLIIVSFNPCKSQGIVGKWKMVSTTTYFTAEGAAKQGGKTMVVNPVSAEASIISEFKSDHTYLTTTSSASSPSPNTLGGTWNLSDNKLTITVDPKYHPAKGVESSTVTIEITGNTMTISKPVPENDIVTRMVTNAKRSSYPDSQ